jgi:hypothetical protein
MKNRKILLIGFIALILLPFGYIKSHDMNINDVGLGVLGWIKKVKGEAVDLSTIENTSSGVVSHQIWSDLLEKYVSATGKVNYEGFISDSIKLSAYLTVLSSNPPATSWTEAHQLAYWINVYNAFTVKLILDNYPLKSIKDISDGLPMINSPWDIKFFKIGGALFDLNTVEHEILRKIFAEPRIHFAINCASVSCPELRNEAYTAATLEAQLEAQAYDFINDPNKNLINDKETQLSKVFDWFKSDFTKKGNLTSFIQKYRPVLNTNNPVEYLEYNWALNN